MSELDQLALEVGRLQADYQKAVAVAADAQVQYELAKTSVTNASRALGDAVEKLQRHVLNGDSLFHVTAGVFSTVDAKADEIRKYGRPACWLSMPTALREME